LARRERRREIERAATELFAELGYQGATIDEIASRAGVTKPIIYRHFESKRELMLSLLERHRDELAAAPLDVLIETRDLPFAERLDGMLEAWFSYVRAHPFVRLLLHDESGDPEVASLVDELHDRQRSADVGLLREFAPHIPEAELQAVGEAVRSSLAGLGLWSLEHPECEQATVERAMRRLVLGLVA
jgi:AcrR family transcriptional regulator